MLKHKKKISFLLDFDGFQWRLLLRRPVEVSVPDAGDDVSQKSGQLNLHV